MIRNIEQEWERALNKTLKLLRADLAMYEKRVARIKLNIEAIEFIKTKRKRCAKSATS